MKEEAQGFPTAWGSVGFPLHPKALEVSENQFIFGKSKLTMGSPSSAQMGTTTKSVVFGRVVMGIRARGIDEWADGVAIFYPAKTWALGSTWS